MVEQDKLVKILTETKKAYEEKKLSLADRLRKMENKQKMFIGILKHWEKNVFSQVKSNKLI